MVDQPEDIEAPSLGIREFDLLNILQTNGQWRRHSMLDHCSWVYDTWENTEKMLLLLVKADLVVVARRTDDRPQYFIAPGVSTARDSTGITVSCAVGTRAHARYGAYHHQSWP